MSSLSNPLCRRPGHTDRHFVYTVSCVKTTHTEKLGCIMRLRQMFREIKTRSFFRVMVLELIYLKMEVSVSEPCDVTRLRKYRFALLSTQLVGFYFQYSKPLAFQPISLFSTGINFRHQNLHLYRSDFNV